MDWPADGDLVFVPARPNGGHPNGGRPNGGGHPNGGHPSPGEPAPAVELRRLRDSGEPVGLAFTSVESLVAVLGPWQPWISVPMFSYVAFLRTQGVRRVEVDPVYHDDVRDWSKQRLAHAAEMQEVEMRAVEMQAADVNTAKGA
jgi:hypothetical protein